MRKILSLVAIMHVLLFANAQTQIQIFAENFETTDTGFTYGGGPGTSIGNNQWIVNKAYNGQPSYPNTTSQDSLSNGIGAITGAPYSHYLHIYNSIASPTDSNANFDPASASDQFAYTGQGYCTLGLSNVKLAFFYIAQGDTTNGPASAYAQIYYSKDGGPWIQTGDSNYTKQRNWRYTQIIDTAFNNASNLRLGFRWVNSSSIINKTISFGVDDIYLVGTSTLAPATLTIDSLPATACQQDYISFRYHIAQPLCLQLFTLQISDANGSFAHPIPLFLSGIHPTDTVGVYNFLLPNYIAMGSCYKIRMVTDVGTTNIIGTPSSCINVNCPAPNTVSGYFPALFFDSLCVGSHMDFSLSSTGVFGSNNVYSIEFSDSAGDFTNPTVVGSLADNQTFNYLPANIKCTIPNLPNGCNYRYRVTSSNPYAELYSSSVYRFCITHCGININNGADIKTCVTDVSGYDTTIAVDIHQFGHTTRYDSSNTFSFQLLRSDMVVLNTGGFGVLHDSLSGLLHLHVPNSADLETMGNTPGDYNARIVADTSNDIHDNVSTMVRISIGATASIPPTVISNPYTCSSTLQTFMVSPANLYSSYQWYAPYFSNQFIDRPGNGITLDFSNAQSGLVFIIQTRELSYGCMGLTSAPDTLLVVVTPSSSLSINSGPSSKCLGDTATLSVSFNPLTYYSWQVNGANIIDTANNQLFTEFDSTGSFMIICQAVNSCGVGIDTTFITVTQCALTDTVWPGDANADGIANNVDLLYVGLGYGDTGAARLSATNTWTRQLCDNWDVSFVGAINHNNADCNGDGVVNANDTMAVVNNYGQVHQKTHSTLRAPGAAPLYLELINAPLMAGDTAKFDIMMGDAAINAERIHGLAFSVVYDASLLNGNTWQQQLDSSWLAPTNSNMLKLSKVFAADGRVDVAISRTDLYAKNGYGKIGSLSVLTPNNIMKDTLYSQLVIDIVDVLAVDERGYPVPLNAKSDTFTVYKEIIGINDLLAIASVKLYPNPSSQRFSLLSPEEVSSYIIYSPQGMEMMHREGVNAKQTIIDVSILAQGIYLLQLDIKGQKVTQRFTVIH